MRLRDRLGRRGSRRSGSYAMDDPVLAALMGDGRDPAVEVNTNNALSIAAVLACIRVRAETFASLPCHVYKKAGDSREIDDGDAIDLLLSRRPNDYQTAYEFWCWKQQSEDITGNAYALIQRNRGGIGDPIGLWPLKSSAMTVRHREGKLLYRYAGDDDIPAQDIHPHDMLHFKGSILKDPFEGQSLVRITANTLGLGIQAERFFGKLLTNGNHFPTYVETDPGTSREAVKDLKEQLRGFSGIFSAGQTRVFGPGMHLKQNAMSVKDMDLSPQLRWNLEQISRIWRVPLPIINDMTHGTYTNSEQAALWLEQYTMSPICVAAEQEVNKSLLIGDRYAKFNLSSLRRGDYKSRTEGYVRMTQAGIMTRNEARSMEDMNPLAGLDDPVISLTNGIVDGSGNIVNPNADAVEPVVDNARSQIRARMERDGNTDRTRKYARMVAGPVVESLNALGIETDLERFIDQSMEG